MHPCVERVTPCWTYQSNRKACIGVQTASCKVEPPAQRASFATGFNQKHLEAKITQRPNEGGMRAISPSFGSCTLSDSRLTSD